MHNNDGIERRCLTLWMEIVSALEMRVSAVNGYVAKAKSHITCELLSGKAVHIKHAAGGRSLIAALDLTEHSIQILKYHGSTLEEVESERKLLFSLLGDGELYVTDGHQLLADPGEVAKLLMSTLLVTRSSRMQ